MYKRIHLISGRVIAAFYVLAAAAITPVVAGTFIVELAEPPAAHFVAKERQQGREVSDTELQTYRSDLRAGQDAFLESLRSRGIGFELLEVQVPDLEGNLTPVDVRYTLVLNGLALDVADGSVDVIKSMPRVKRVHPQRLMKPLLDKSVPYVRAPEVYGDIAEVSPFDDFREGFEGQGINISVIDTGVEWSHEMFGGDATPPRLGLEPPAAAVNRNEKVIYYLSLIDNLIDDFGHGTHVSADAAGFRGFSPGPDGTPLTADDVPINGVAPQARIMHYKVCSGPGSAAGVFGCLGTSIILAIEDSVSPRTLNGFPKPVAHVINMSLGGPGGPDDATAVAADNASLLGTIVVSSAGNSGPGEATVGAPAAGRRVIAVGANVDPGVIPNSIEVVDKPDAPAIVAAMAPDSNLGSKIQEPIVGNYVFAGKADTPDQVPLAVAGNICLTIRGSTAEAAGNGTGLFANKALQCESRGAIATVIFNNAPEAIGPILAPASRPVFTINGVDGQLLLDLGFDAAGISNFRISLNPEDPSLFEPIMAGFSSRGPVQGLGQVKPDVTAPGVNVLSATSPVGVPVLSMQDATRYISASGTSFSGPHVAGAAALVKQAHLGWNPDMVRTALINSATNLRQPDGTPKPDGTETENVLAQGGGLIDVFEAVNAKTLMGVTGDGLSAPSILGSHSFGEVPVVNSRVTHAETVDITILDTADDGGTYNLSVANNRDLQLDGIEVTIVPDSVTVPAGGSASFTVSAEVNGDLIRDTKVPRVESRGNTISFSLDPIQMQWYVEAERSDGAESLRMPFFLRPIDSVPAPQFGRDEQQVFTGTMLAGDANSQLVEGATFHDFPIEVSAGTLRLRGDLEFPEIVDDVVADLDLFLLNQEGEVIAQSAQGGGPEHVDIALDRSGSFTWRVTGFANGPTDFELTSTREVGAAPPELATIAGDFTNSDGQSVDFDGDVQLAWTPSVGAEEGFEVERSSGGQIFEIIAEVGGDVTELTLADQPEGENFYRVRALFPGQIGFFVTEPGNTESVVVSRRSQMDITSQVDTAISNVSLNAGVFQFDLAMTNNSASDFLPLVEFNVIGIDSASGTVRAINADNGGSGTSVDDPALFDYSHELGSDDTFSAGEMTGTRRLEFSDEQSELFTFDAAVTAFEGSSGSGDASTTSSSGDSGGAQSSTDSGVATSTTLLRFTVDPLTGMVSAELLDGLL